MSTTQTRWSRIANLTLTCSLTIVALWLTWTIGNSFVSYGLFIYKYLGPQSAFQGICLLYVVIVFAALLVVDVHVACLPSYMVTPAIRLYRKILLILAFVPGLNMLLALVFIGWGVFYSVLGTAAYITGLFSDVFSKEERV